MLNPRLTNCTECIDTLNVICDIDYNIVLLSKCVYNSIILGTKTKCSKSTLSDLLNYRRILVNKYYNPEYAGNFSLETIVGRVRILTGGIRKPEVFAFPTTTTTTLPITTTTTTTLFALIMFSISSLSVECCDPPGYGFQTIDSVAYHSGINPLPEIGDYVYTDSLGTSPIAGTGEASGYTMTGPAWLEIGNFGLVANTTCEGCR